MEEVCEDVEMADAAQQAEDLYILNQLLLSLNSPPLQTSCNQPPVTVVPMEQHNNHVPMDTDLQVCTRTLKKSAL